jgi:two-component system response regulator RegX3
MKAVLRRHTDSSPVAEIPGIIEVGSVRMDVDRHIVEVHGEKVSMPLKEFELLELLLENANRVLTRGQIIDRVWGSNYFGDTKTLDVHIKRIRSKIEDDPARPVHLLTVRGLGYKFEA